MHDFKSTPVRPLNLQNIDIRLLRVFDAVVQSGGFSAAQIILNSSQSTISEQMATLESRLGITLCHRGRTGFRLTSSGAVVYEAARRLLTAADHFADDVQTLKSAEKELSGPFHLGLIDNTLSDPAAPVSCALQKLITRAPGISLSLFIGSPPELQLQVLQGALHMAIGVFPTPVNGLKYSPLYQEEHGLYCMRDHTLSTHPFDVESEWQSQLDETKVVVRRYMRDRELSRLNVRQAATSVENIEAQAMLILSGAYIGFLPLHYVESQPWGSRLHRLHPQAIGLTSEFSAIVPRQAKLPRVTHSFFNDLRSVLPPLTHTPD